MTYCNWPALQANEGNRLLELRSNAGTHDIKLAHDTLKQLKSANSESSEVSLVRYDKSAHSGRGDRKPKSEWQSVKGKVDVVLFEGWMLGFRPLLDQAAQKVALVLCNVQYFNFDSKQASAQHQAASMY